MALAIFLASSEVSLECLNDHFCRSRQDGRHYDPVGVLHHERVRVRPVHGPGRWKAATCHENEYRTLAVRVNGPIEFQYTPFGCPESG
jgi:hypothetical protein